MIIILDKKDIEYCILLAKKRAKYKNEHWQQNKYRKGLLNSDKNPYLSERLGVYGEMAFSKFLGKIPLDENISDIGDPGYDFIYKNKKIDTKTQWQPAYWAIKKYNCYGPFYLSADDKNGREKELKADIYFFETIDSILKNGKKLNIEDIKEIGSDLEATQISIKLWGYISKENILKNKEQRKNRVLWENKGPGNKYNYYIKATELLFPKKTPINKV